jgi:arsenate reductase
MTKKLKSHKNLDCFMKTKILILCTGNSCRSQMAEGILKSMEGDLEVYSAGTKPEKQVNPNAIQVMKEIGIDISKNRTKNADEFLDKSFDYVITVCDNAKETCPVFTGKVKHRLHIGFPDPADARGEKDKVLAVYRRVRDEIKNEFGKWYKSVDF